MPVNVDARAPECIHQRWRHHKIPKSQGWEQSFTERANVKDSSCVIHSLERRLRTSAVAVFSIVVIFENPGVVVFCPFQELLPPLKAHGDAERILMRWSWKCDARAGECRHTGAA